VEAETLGEPPQQLGGVFAVARLGAEEDEGASVMAVGGHLLNYKLLIVWEAGAR
jgi:hypothetical protein